MIAGNFTGVELKLLVKERSLADLAQLIPNGLEVTTDQVSQKHEGAPQDGGQEGLQPRPSDLH